MLFLLSLISFKFSIVVKYFKTTYNLQYIVCEQFYRIVFILDRFKVVVLFLPTARRWFVCTECVNCQAYTYAQRSLHEEQHLLSWTIWNVSSTSYTNLDTPQQTSEWTPEHMFTNQVIIFSKKTKLKKLIHFPLY